MRSQKAVAQSAMETTTTTTSGSAFWEAMNGMGTGMEMAEERGADDGLQLAQARMNAGEAVEQQQNDAEMEELTTITSINALVAEHEDPDSRDSGISLTHTTTSSSSSQGIFENAIFCSNAKTHCTLKPNNNKNNQLEDFIDDDIDVNAIDKDDFEAFYARSPEKKRLRSSRNSYKGPTDFRSLIKSHNLSNLKEESDSDEENTSSDDHVLPIVPFQSSSSTTRIPPSARSIHRVHSASVLELSHDHSWGSPDTLRHYSLVTLERPQVPHCAFRSIAPATLTNLLDSLTGEEFLKKFILIDCRYPYEFDGGHIQHSLNVWQTKNVIDIFYPDDVEEFEQISQRIPIFYCEFSQKRGPKMAMALREVDRTRNEHRYPYVDFPEIYLLDRGYRHFFKDHRRMKYCSPESYVQMWDPAYAEQRKCFDLHHRVKKRRRQITRH